MYPTQILNGKVDRDIRDESGVMRGSRTPGILRCFACSRLSMKAGVSTPAPYQFELNQPEITEFECHHNGRWNDS